MHYDNASETIRSHRQEISALRDKVRETLAQQQPQTVEDYEFTTVDGPIKLSELFEDQSTLFVIHNMGRSCNYCTLWADGLNGVIDHLRSRAAFVLATPDSPEIQQQFAASRNWRLKLVSHANTRFAADMGYEREAGWLPGVSVFHRRVDRVVERIADTEFGPGDDFCSVWHLFDLMPDTGEPWQPQLSYNE
jgi:predicted dithiol-disulfide oxidoreductase (DUF899 family)